MGEFMETFENVWCRLRGRWCDEHDLGGAHAFSHDLVKSGFFHRAVQVNVDDSRVEGLIEDALRLFKGKAFDCGFTLSPQDRPVAFAERLIARGFHKGVRSSAMEFVVPADIPSTNPALDVRVIKENEFEIWADVMCRSFEFEPDMGEVGRPALKDSAARCYLALVEGEPAGTTLLYSDLEMGYIDQVGTLPEFRRKGVATALVRHAIEDSVSIGNRWTALESESGAEVERMYEGLGFCTRYHRQRYVRSTSDLLL